MVARFCGFDTATTGATPDDNLYFLVGFIDLDDLGRDGHRLHQRSAGGYAKDGVGSSYHR